MQQPKIKQAYLKFEDGKRSTEEQSMRREVKIKIQRDLKGLYFSFSFGEERDPLLWSAEKEG